MAIKMTRPKGSKDGTFHGVDFKDGKAELPINMIEKAKILKKFYAVKLVIEDDGEEGVDDAAAAVATSSKTSKPSKAAKDEGLRE